MRSAVVTLGLLTVFLLALLLSAAGNAQAAPLSQDAEDVTLNIINDSDQNLCSVIVCPPGFESAEDCPVAVGTVIRPGESRAFSIPPDTYVLALADCQARILLRESISLSGSHDVRFSGPTQATLEPQDVGASLRIVNESNNPEETICHVHISPITSDGWGKDWLGEAENIPPGECRTFDVAAGDYNVLLANCDEEVLLMESDLSITDQYELPLTSPGPCAVLSQEGLDFYDQAQYRDALERFQDALTCYREADDRKGEGKVLNNIGVIYDDLGQTDEGLEYHRKALSIYREIGDLDGEGDSLNHIGFVYSGLEQHEKALDYYQQALSIYQEIGNWVGESNSLNNIGVVYYRLERYEEALDYHQEALDIHRGIGNQQGEANSLNNIGAAYHKLKQYEKALDYYEEALSIRREIGGPAVVGDTLNTIGNIHHRVGRYQQALDYYQQVLSIRREIGDQAGEGATLNSVGVTYESLGRYEEAMDNCQQALDIYRDIGDEAGEATSLNSIGGIYDSLGQYEKALAYYRQALDIQREIGDRAGEGTSLNNIGGIYDSLGPYQQALDYYRQALDIQREIGDRAGEATSLNNIGTVHSSLGQYQQALDYHRQALDIQREIGDRAGEGGSLRNIGGIYERLGQYQEALDHCQQALSIFREIGNRKGEGASLDSLGGVYDRLGQYQEALDHCQQALSIFREIGNREGEGASLDSLGGVYESLGQYREALYCYRQALDIQREIGDRAGEGGSLNNIGGIYDSLGQYQEALKYCQEALSIRREIGDRAGEATSLNNMGTVYCRLRQYQQALDCHQQALDICREIGDQAGDAANLNNIGAAHEGLGQYEEALDYYRRALDISRKIGDQAGVGTGLNNVGRAYDCLGQYEEALAYYRQALDISHKIDDREGEGISLNNIGAIYDSLGQHEKALDYYRRSLDIHREIDDRAAEWISLNNIGNTYDSLGQYQEALEYYQQSIAVWETLREEIRVEEWKSSFTTGGLGPCDSIAKLLLKLNRPDRAFYHIQRAKARTFLDQMGNARIDPRATDDPALIEEEEVLRGEIQALDARLREEWATPEKQRSEEAIDNLKVRLQQKRDAYEDVLIRLKLENPEYASLVSVETSTLTETQQLLTDTTLIEYYVAPTETLAFVVRQDGFHAEAISVTRDSLSLTTSQFFTETQTTLQGVPPSLQALYDALIAPVEPYLTTRQLLIAPHDVLHYVPFAALYDGEQYLIERHTLAQIPSASVLPFILEKAVGEPFGGPALILGDPDGSLPFSRREAKAVAELHASTAHVGSEALERLVWEQGPDADVLHLSAHGAYNRFAPLFSRILLTTTAESEHDGVLEVHEVYNLNLNSADLAVLSACQTNLGQRSAGDDIVGLTRAFIYAGAPSVVSSLWSVEDAATRDLMVAFYGYLEEDVPRAEALRRAQIDLLQTPRTAHPFYWSGFVLSGYAGSPLQETPSAPTPVPAEEESSSSDTERSGGMCLGPSLPLLVAGLAVVVSRVRRERGL